MAIKRYYKALTNITLLTFTLLILTALSACGGGETSDDDFRIVNITPDEGSSTADVDSQIDVTFNKPVDNELVSNATFYLIDEHTHQKVESDIIISDNKRTISLKPDALFFERHYQVTVHHTITDTEGEHIKAGTKNWEFFTREEPAAFNFQPEIGATEVSTKSKIKVNFERTITTTSVSAATFQLLDAFGQVIPSQITAEDRTAILTPNQPLALNRTYIVSIESGILDTNGAPLSGFPFSWSFSTRATISNSFHFGTSSNDEAQIIATDNLNNLYIAGQTEGTFTTQTSQGSYDAFVAKLDSAGNSLWVNQFGNDKFDTLTGLIITPSGEVVVSGHSDTRTFFGDDNEQSDILFAKIDAQGNPPVTHTTGASDGHDFSKALVFDSLNNYYVIGSTMGTVQNSATPNQGMHDIFLAKYDSLGNFLWVKQYGTAADEIVNGAVIANDTIYVISSIQETDPTAPPLPIGFPPGAPPPPFLIGDTKTKIFAFNTEGQYQWDKQFTDRVTRHISNAVRDSSNNLFVATMGLNTNGTPGPPENTVIHKLDINGDEIDSFTIISQELFEVSALAIDPTGALYVGGIIMTQPTFFPPGSGMGGPINFVEPEPNLIIKKVDATGVEQWTATVKAKRHAKITDITLTANGDIYATGFTHGGVDGNSMIGSQDAFVFKVNAFGQVQ